MSGSFTRIPDWRTTTTIKGRGAGRSEILATTGAVASRCMTPRLIDDNVYCPEYTVYDHVPSQCATGANYRAPRTTHSPFPSFIELSLSDSRVPMFTQHLKA